jgi:DNA-binding NarL/FixJ family response regulator
MIRVVLADDHAIVRQGLRTLLETKDSCIVVLRSIQPVEKLPGSCV